MQISATIGLTVQRPVHLQDTLGIPIATGFQFARICYNGKVLFKISAYLSSDDSFPKGEEIIPRNKVSKYKKTVIGGSKMVYRISD